MKFKKEVKNALFIFDEVGEDVNKEHMRLKTRSILIFLEMSTLVQ